VDVKRLAQMDWVTVWRSGSLKFHVREGKASPPEGVLLWQTYNLCRLTQFRFGLMFDSLD